MTRKTQGAHRAFARRERVVRGGRLRGNIGHGAAPDSPDPPQLGILLRHEDDRLPGCYPVHHQELVSSPRRITAGRRGSVRDGAKL